MEGCNGTCIMEGRFAGIEERMREQSNQYNVDRVEDAKQSTSMKKDIEKILEILSPMNKKLDDVLEENQKQKIKAAESKNEAPASKWKSLSANARAVIVTVIGSTLVLLVGYLLARAGIK